MTKIPLKPSSAADKTLVPTARLRSAMGLIERQRANVEGMLIERRAPRADVVAELERLRGSTYAFALVTGNHNVFTMAKAMDWDFEDLERQVKTYTRLPGRAPKVPA